MNFRHHKFKPVYTEVSTPVLDTVLEQSENDTYKVVSVPNSSLARLLPSREDYTLEKLLNANIPLNDVSVSLDDVPSDANIENFVNNNLSND